MWRLIVPYVIAVLIMAIVVSTVIVLAHISGVSMDGAGIFFTLLLSYTLGIVTAIDCAWRIDKLGRRE